MNRLKTLKAPSNQDMVKTVQTQFEVSSVAIKTQMLPLEKKTQMLINVDS